VSAQDKIYHHAWQPNVGSLRASGLWLFLLW